MEWLNANDIQPQDEIGVVGYSKQWIDQNSNTKGLRICYYNRRWKIRHNGRKTRNMDSYCY